MKRPFILCSVLFFMTFISGCKFDMPSDKYTGTWTGTYRLSNWMPGEGDATVVVTENTSSTIDIYFSCIQDTIVINNCYIERFGGGLYGSTVLIYNNSTAYDDAAMYVNLDMQDMVFYYDSAGVSFDFSAYR